MIQEVYRDGRRYCSVVHGMYAECSMGIMKNYLNADIGHGSLERYLMDNIPQEEERYPNYRNSWQNPDVYTQFPHRQDTNPTADSKSNAHEYANSYSSRLAYEIKDFTIGELKQMLSIRTNGLYGKNIFGYGPLQATSDNWHDKYLNAINQSGFSDDIFITKEVALLIDAMVNLNEAKAKCPDNAFPYVDSNGTYKELTNMSKHNNTFDDVIKKFKLRFQHRRRCADFQHIGQQWLKFVLVIMISI